MPLGKPSHLLPWGELLSLQLQPCAPELPLVAPRPGRAGGCSDGGGGQQRHQNRSRLWAGAALGGSLCRASSKDGQRVRRRPHPRSPLARGPAPRPRAAAGGRCGADLLPKASRREASGTGRGRTRPGRLRSPPAAEARRQWPRERRAGPSVGLPWRPPHTCVARRGRGTRAPGPVGGAWCPRVQSPHQAPGRGGSLAGTQTGPWRWACGNPCSTAGEEAPGWRGRGCAAFLYLGSAERHKVSLF